MNKKFAVLLLLFSAAIGATALSGCSTKPIESHEMRQKPIENRFVSVKFPEQVTECIVSKWQHIPYTGPLLSRKTPTGYTIIQNTLGGVGADPAFVSDIRDTPTGTETIFYTYDPLVNGATYFLDTVKECQ